METNKTISDAIITNAISDAILSSVKATVDKKLKAENLKPVTIVKEWKKFRRYSDGAEYYGMGKTAFIQLARDAKAIYKPNRMPLVNCEILEKYLEGFREV